MKISPALLILLNYQADEVLVFPWDPDYSRTKAGEPAHDTGHGLPSSLPDKTTRLVLADGRWVPHCKRPA